MRVYIVKQYNDFYDTLEDIHLFSTKHKALNALRAARDDAKRFGTLVEDKLDFKAAPGITVMDTDNLQYTFVLDPLTKDVA